MATLNLAKLYPAQDTIFSSQNEVEAGIHETRIQFHHQLIFWVLQARPLLTVPFLLLQHARAGRSQNDA